MEIRKEKRHLKVHLLLAVVGKLEIGSTLTIFQPIEVLRLQLVQLAIRHA